MFLISDISRGESAIERPFLPIGEGRKQAANQAQPHSGYVI
jgi:hypothetical protein